MARGFARLRERNQLTLPQAVVEKMGLNLGDLVEFTVTGQDTIEVRPARIVTVGTAEARREEEAAREDIRQGRYSVISSVDRFQQHLDRVQKGDHPSASQSPPSGTVPGGTITMKALLEGGVHFDRRPNAEAEDSVSTGNVRDSGGAATMIRHLSGPQRQEVEDIVEAVLKKFSRGAVGSPSIMLRHAENDTEQH